MVPTQSIANDLKYPNTVILTRAVDCNLFKSGEKKLHNTIICVSRVSKEKGLDDFCQIQGWKKILVGDGPYLKQLKKKYKDVEFMGKIDHNLLCQQYQRADVFVFPSRTDSYGIVQIEAAATGLPVVAYPEARDVVENGYNGIITNDLRVGVEECYKNLEQYSKNARESALKKSWNIVVDQFNDYSKI